MHRNTKMTPKKALSNFKQVLREAAKFYGIPAYEINYAQFTYVARGRVGGIWIARLGGYATLRGYCAPKKDRKLDRATLDMIKKMLREAA